MNWQPVLDFLASQGPAILILVYSYMNGRAIRAEQQVKMMDLQTKIEANHAKILSKFDGLSDSDILSGAIVEPISSSQSGPKS